ncbi:hypothetical protein H5T88_04860 [bacterium]|nr:hypothetical protein [bacterium]
MKLRKLLIGLQPQSELEIGLKERFQFVRLLLEREQFREVLKKGGIKNIYLVGGVLFNIEGTPATVENDKDFGICYNGLIRARDEIVNTLNLAGIPFKITENTHPERAFLIESLVEKAKYNKERINYLFDIVDHNELLQTIKGEIV